ncbi:MAG: CBS domain-containing protein [Candidatus Hodarchaeales archaeon]
MFDEESEVLVGNLLKIHNRENKWVSNEKIITMPSNQPVAEAAKMMLENQVGSIIISNGDIKGIITKGDIIDRVVGRALDPGIVIVDDVMSKPVSYVSVDESLENTMLIMGKENIERILVVEDNDIRKPLGIISTNDILKFAPGLLRIHRERLLIDTITEENSNDNNRAFIKFEGFCDDCGNYSEALKSANGYTLCPVCTEIQPENYHSSSHDIM